MSDEVNRANFKSLFINPDLADAPVEQIEIVWGEGNDIDFPDYPEPSTELVESTKTIKPIEPIKPIKTISTEPYFEYFYSWGKSISGLNDWVGEHVDKIGNVGKEASNEAIMKSGD